MDWGKQAVHEEVGAQGEHAVKDLLESRGYTVAWGCAWSTADLTVGDRVAVEIKTANLGRGKRPKRWQFSIYNPQKRGLGLKGKDVLILRCQNGNDATHYVIPAEDLPDKLRKLDITSASYTGKYARYRERWEALDAALASRSEPPQREALPF